jgi:hypothetical protein
VEIALVGGTKGPPAGPSAAAAFDVVTALALATARYDLSAGFGAPYQWPKTNNASTARSRGGSGGGGGGGTQGYSTSSGGSASGSLSGGTARLTSLELGRCLGLVFPGADRDGTEDSGM